MTHKEALYKYALSMGDNALVQSYRLSEWCSNAPMLEEDLALTNFALDMTGRAQLLLGYAGKIEGLGRTDDDLAYKRKERDFYNHLLVELPNGDFAFTITRLFLNSVYEFYFFNELQYTTDDTLAAIAAKTLKEVKYHMAHATDWVQRLGGGTQESNARMQKAVNELWMYTGELFEQTEEAALLRNDNTSVDLTFIQPRWKQRVEEVLREAGLNIPANGYMQTGGNKGIHSEHLGHILTEMQYLQRAYPEATW